MQITDAFENNQTWVLEKLSNDPDYFKRLAEGQHPQILYIGCSDSRVTAEDMIGAQPGDLFVHRNIANVVANTDSSARAVINYAVEHLKVKHVVVCGHYGCGGVGAAMQPDDLGMLNPWLKNIRDVYRLHADELRNIDNELQRYKRLVELNVQEQCLNVYKIPEVQASISRDGLRLHGWVFNIATGRLADLKLDFNQLMAELHDIYRLQA